MKGQRTKTQVKFRLPVAAHKTLQAIAAYRGESLTATINRALEQYVEQAKRASQSGRG